MKAYSFRLWRFVWLKPDVYFCQGIPRIAGRLGWISRKWESNHKLKGDNRQ